MKLSKVIFMFVVTFLLMIFVDAKTLQKSETLKNVKKNKILKCGVSTGITGFSSTDSSGKWQGIDVDVCRAVASAIFADATKVKFVPLTAKERFTALQSGEIDLLVRSTTWTLTRDSSLGLNFAGVNYYDGQGFLVAKKLKVKSALELGGATYCIQAGTTTELNLADYLKSKGMKYKALTFDTSKQTIDAFIKGRCDVVTSDASQLYSLALKVKDPNSVKVLPQIISKEPLGPVVRQGDDEWFNIVKWSLIAMFNAEELGITSNNVDKMLKSKNPSIKRFLGLTNNDGKNLGLKKKWAYNIVKNVGNYGQSFARNVGKDSPLKINRGLNKLWINGGLHYGAPFR